MTGCTRDVSTGGEYGCVEEVHLASPASWLSWQEGSHEDRKCLSICGNFCRKVGNQTSGLSILHWAKHDAGDVSSRAMERELECFLPSYVL